jgi:hypothetical protein
VSNCAVEFDGGDPAQKKVEEERAALPIIQGTRH